MIETTEINKKDTLKTSKENILNDEIENNELDATMDELKDLNSVDFLAEPITFDEKDYKLGKNGDLKNTISLNEKTPLEDTSNEVKKIDIEDANTTNCLALTIQKDHKLVAVKNVFLHSLKVTWKVIVSTAILTILKIFS